jgi:hypothetical protein
MHYIKLMGIGGSELRPLQEFVIFSEENQSQNSSFPTCCAPVKVYILTLYF